MPRGGNGFALRNEVLFLLTRKMGGYQSAYRSRTQWRNVTPVIANALHIECGRNHKLTGSFGVVACLTTTIRLMSRLAFRLGSGGFQCHGTEGSARQLRMRTGPRAETTGGAPPEFPRQTRCRGELALQNLRRYWSCESRIFAAIHAYKSGSYGRHVGTRTPDLYRVKVAL